MLVDLQALTLSENSFEFAHVNGGWQAEYNMKSFRDFV